MSRACDEKSYSITLEITQSESHNTMRTAATMSNMQEIWAFISERCGKLEEPKGIRKNVKRKQKYKKDRNQKNKEVVNITWPKQE